MLRCLYTARKEIPPCCPCAALCETIGYRAPVVPANQNVAAEGPLQAKDKTRKRMSKGLPYFPFQRRLFFSLNMILPPLVMAVSLEPGAFDFRTRIKGGGRKAPASRSQRPAVRGVSRDCGISPQRRARWSLNRLFGFQVVVDLRKSRGSKRFPAFSPPLCTAIASGISKIALHKQREKVAQSRTMRWC